MRILQMERIPVLEEQLRGQCPRRLTLIDRFAMRVGLWMLLWSTRFPRYDTDPLTNDEYRRREERERQYVELLGINRPF